MEPNNINNISCPFCSSQIDTSAYFCPNCGKKIREKPLSVTASSQILLYLVSVLLPPFWFPLTYRYLKSKDPKAKKIGLISLVLTITALLLITWLTGIFLSNFKNNLLKDLNNYQSIGY